METEMSSRRALISFFACILTSGHALSYEPPETSKPLLAAVDFAQATALDENYRSQFQACDNGVAGIGAKDHFRGKSLILPGKPQSKQYYLCSRDPSNLRALLKLKDGGIFWQSKMALDVDGAWAAWNGVPGATDLKETSLKWLNVADKRSQAAQIDPDKIPFVVMPMDGIKKLTGSASTALGNEFVQKTKLKLGDMGVVIYQDKWTPVMLADGGPFMRLGEGSSRVFESIGQSRCKKWNADNTICIGQGGNAYPYRNFGIGSGVLFILYPGSQAADITSSNALAKLCAFAKAKLNLTGGAACP
jgi:hypothetical protein